MRQIDALRNSAVQMNVSTDGDDSAIKEMCVIEDSMYKIKGNGIYLVKLADQIDPNRTNATIPNTHQRVLGYGANSALVCKTLLTAKRLFSSQTKALGPSFPYDRVLGLTLEALKDLVVMHDMHLRLNDELAAIEESLNSRSAHGGSFSIPTIDGIQASVETFFQKGAHAADDLFTIVQQFYPEEIGKGWFDGLFDLANKRYGSDAVLTKFLTDALPVLKLMRNARNCVEHPRQAHKVDVFDITLMPSGELRPPALEIIHPETHQPLMEVRVFMEQAVEQLASTFELMLAFLCYSNVVPIAGLPIQVVQYPPELAEPFGVRFGYGMYDDSDRIIPFD